MRSEHHDPDNIPLDDFNVSPAQEEILLRRRPEARPEPKGRSPATQVAAKSNTKTVSSSGFIPWLVLLLALLLAAASWYFLGLVKSLEQRMGQTNALAQQLATKLGVTDAAVTSAGSTLQGQLNNLDSEVKKLWALANDKHKKSIAANEAAIKQQAALLEDYKKQNTKLDKKVQDIAARLNKTDTLQQLTMLQEEMELLGKTVKTSSQQLNTVKQQLSQLSQAGTSNDLTGQLQVLDSSRRQLSRDIVQIQTDIDNLYRLIGQPSTP